MTNQDITYRFEVEHIFSTALFGDPARAGMLNRFGFSAEMRSNRIALFSREDVVNNLQTNGHNLHGVLRNAGGGMRRSVLNLLILLLVVPVLAGCDLLSILFRSSNRLGGCL